MPAEPPERPLFAPRVILAAFGEAQVRVVVVGAYAGQMLDLPLQTLDLDLVPDLERTNLQRLAETLHALRATVRIRNHDRGPVALPPDGGLLARAPILNLHVPDAGDVDLIHRAAEGLDFPALAARARRVPVVGSRHRALVMSEADWVAAKEAPPVREKDALHLRVYAAWRASRSGAS